VVGADPLSHGVAHLHPSLAVTHHDGLWGAFDHRLQPGPLLVQLRCPPLSLRHQRFDAAAGEDKGGDVHQAEHQPLNVALRVLDRHQRPVPVPGAIPLGPGEGEAPLVEAHRQAGVPPPLEDPAHLQVWQDVEEAASHQFLRGHPQAFGEVGVDPDQLEVGVEVGQVGVGVVHDGLE
jgi:hypothetical protein